MNIVIEKGVQKLADAKKNYRYGGMEGICETTINSWKVSFTFTPPDVEVKGKTRGDFPSIEMDG